LFTDRHAVGEHGRTRVIDVESMNAICLPPQRDIDFSSATLHEQRDRFMAPIRSDGYVGDRTDGRAVDAQ
jgi:hypothetical protein